MGKSNAETMCGTCSNVHNSHINSGVRDVEGVKTLRLAFDREGGVMLGRGQHVETRVWTQKR